MVISGHYSVSYIKARQSQNQDQVLPLRMEHVRGYILAVSALRKPKPGHRAQCLNSYRNHVTTCKGNVMIMGNLREHVKCRNGDIQADVQGLTHWLGINSF